MSRLYAVSDIHGMLSKFESALLKAGLVDKDLNWSGGDSTLINLGDICDRGPDSKGCIDLILKLKRQAKKVGGKVVTLAGNHETMLIDGLKKQAWYNCWMDNGGYQCCESYEQVIKESDPDGFFHVWSENNPRVIYDYHREYFDNLEQFIIINEIMFVHAGIDPRGDLDSLTRGLQVCNNGKTHLWIREQFYNYPNANFLERYKVKKVVFGHTPTRSLSSDNNLFMKPTEKLNGLLLGIDTGSFCSNGSVTIVEFDNDRSWSIAGCS